jgi:hypothetical protein
MRAMGCRHESLSWACRAALCAFLMFIAIGLVITADPGRERYESLNNDGTYVIGEECKVPMNGGTYMFTEHFDWLQEHPHGDANACVFKPMAGAGLLDANLNACTANSPLFDGRQVNTLKVEGRNCVVRFQAQPGNYTMRNTNIEPLQASACNSGLLMNSFVSILQAN